ncbi:hypothetical protein H9Q72_006951 [Fusarium xylarioides]|uniref:BTB domain-containing protein n=1 Tax=Fusarium xylarioides TaxID=221167 RepID=A0A9P7L581_9HYPO|nr:hypothetical protein H9Q70_007023 [Fusarium xylarioides]KAG5764979.1 hypothetical protein H9Q72_006951 [Fusarium xylarioides]KAG5776571.1 hypothetical protein H9Q73_009757 [Fusarium xylarioides]
MQEPGPAERLTGEGAKVAIYFGAMQGGEVGPTVEYVHAQAILLTCPEFLQRVTKWGIISLPFATDEAISAMIRFFYTGKVPFHEVHKFTLRPDLESAYDLAIHVYSQAVYSEITNMKDQATEYMTSLFPYIEPAYMLAYTHSVLEPLYPELNFKWVAVQAGLASNYHVNDKLMEIVDAERDEDIKRFKASVARREAAWVKINREGEEEGESAGETEANEATEVDNEVAVESEGENSEAEESEGGADAGTDDESYDRNGKLRIIGADGLINLDLANYPPGVYRW